jgi:hypothetical protein
MRRLLLPLLGALLASVTTSAARADDLSPTPVFMPVPTALTLEPLFGEPTGPTVGPDPALAVLPLRLSMLGMAFPHAGTGPSDPFHCAPREDPSGNSRYGFPVEHQVYLAMTSQLVLHGFSRLGCPIDSVVGGGVTYTVPLSHDVSIVPSAGVLARSNGMTGRVPSKRTVRVDLIMNTGNGRTLGIGVGKRGNRQGLQLTGTW